MEPVEVQNIVNQENKETKTFSLHPAIFVIIFLIILGCIIGVAAGPIYLISIGKFELAIGLPTVLAGCAFFFAGVLALLMKGKIGLIFVIVGLIVAIYGVAQIIPEKFMGLVDFHGSFYLFTNVFWSLVILGIGLGLLWHNKTAKNNMLVVEAKVKEYIEIKEGSIRALVEFYYDNQIYEIICRRNQIPPGTVVGSTVSITIDKNNPSKLSKYHENKKAIFGFAMMFIVMAIYILVEVIIKFF